MMRLTGILQLAVERLSITLRSPWMPTFIPWSYQRLAIADRLGFLGACLVVFTGLWLHNDVHHVGWILVFLAALLAFPELWPRLRRSTVFWLGVAFVIYVGIRGWATQVEYGGDPPGGGPSASEWARGSVLPVLLAALWMRDDNTRLKWFIGAAGISFVILIATTAQWDSILNFDFSDRRTFSHIFPGLLGAIAAMAFLGVLCIGLAGTLRAHDAARKKTAYVLLCITVLGMVVTAFILLVSGSRQTWLGILIALPLVAILLVRQVSMDRAWSRQAIMVTVSAVVIGVLLAVVAASATQTIDTVNKRFQAIWETTVAVVRDWDATLENPPDHSSHQRLYLPVAGLKWLAEKPAFGWGTESNSLVMKADPHIPDTRAHFHNMYIELLYALGIVGGVLFMAGYLILAGGTLSNYRGSRMDPYIFIYTLGIALMFAVILLFTVRIHQDIGRTLFFFVGTLLAIPYATALVHSALPVKPNMWRSPDGS